MAHLSLFAFNQLIKDTLTETLAPNYWIIAEIGEMRLNQKGHCYMELVEKEGNFIQAKIRANIWAYTYRNLSSEFLRATGTPLKPGIKVLLNVAINFHEVYGMSLTVNNIDPNFTLGERSRLREETLQKLKAEGALETNKQLRLPLAPQKLAVISSETAAGYQDFTEQLKANPRGFDIDITLFPALMQGNDAPASIQQALNAIGTKPEHFDLIVLIRGGGAQTDLDCFDTYELGKAISQAPLPLFTGIGHERDQTIADLVAHTALKTPTAVAEFILNGLYLFDDQLNDLAYRMERQLHQQIQQEHFQLSQYQKQLSSQVNYLLNRHTEKVERLGKNLKHETEYALKMHRVRLENFEKEINLSDPIQILKKGYSITLKNGHPIQTENVISGDEIETRTHNKIIVSKVIKSTDDV
ncbi:exodeoxyribonuclease VII large subunit [Roseivirga pacifica]|uniref:exodeoxyribonuclease VII large subunit n=1 Tax=Roseivirga pacifica TaxID=1267423 RepID=UPI00227B6996|nr:exodeoxyribonuclease VII large subunit [Roseivirga pacifica]